MTIAPRRERGQGQVAADSWTMWGLACVCIVCIVCIVFSVFAGAASATMLQPGPRSAGSFVISRYTSPPRGPLAQLGERRERCRRDSGDPRAGDL